MKQPAEPNSDAPVPTSSRTVQSPSNDLSLAQKEATGLYSPSSPSAQSPILCEGEPCGSPDAFGLLGFDFCAPSPPPPPSASARLDLGFSFNSPPREPEPGAPCP